MSSRQMPAIPNAPVSYKQLHRTLHAPQHKKLLAETKRAVDRLYSLAQEG